MAYIIVEDFRFGLDTRKSAVTAPPGTLRQCDNMHITRGGELEKAKRMISRYSLPADDTFGLGRLRGDLYVFGSTSSPVLPDGVNYQRLVHPDSASIDMTGIIALDISGRKFYVVAEFENGDVFHYYDGTLVNDWRAGVVRSGMTNNSGIAAYLEGLIDDDAVNTSVLTNVITVTAAVAGTPFTISAEALNVTGGTDNQTAVVATTTPSVEGVAEVLSSASFTITAGSANVAATGTVTLTGGAAGSVNSITVNGVTITSGAVAFNTTLTQTATDVAANINAFTSSPDYTAVAVGAVITISAAAAVGAGANGFVVVSAATTITTADVNMSGGTTNSISSVKVDGVEILSVPVLWVTSHTVFAANVAAQISSYTSSPDYTGSSSNAVVTAKGAAGSGSAPNGRVITVTVNGSVTVSGSGSAFAGGVSAVSGQAQVSTVTIGGSFEVGDKFTITINDYPWGFETRPVDIGRTLLTLKKKLYVGGGENLYFSGINEPTKYSTADTGAGFINMASEAPDFEDITGLGIYYNNLAVFSEETTQIWAVDADPTANAQAQVIPDIGTFAPKSIRNNSDGDLMFLTRSGVRSLRARDSSNLANISETGTAIDEEIIALLDTLTEDEKAAVCSIKEPANKHYWLAIDDVIYVFAFFSGSKVSAWSKYTPDLVFTDFATISGQLFARADDTIYLSGGEDIAATGTVTLTGGASGTVTQITVDGVNLMSAPVAYNVSLAHTADLVAQNITAFTSSPNYTAAAVGAVITITAVTEGTGPNGFVIAATTTTITTSHANMSGGTDGNQYVAAGEAIVTLPFLDAKTPATPKVWNGIDVALQGLWKVEIATDPEQPDEFDTVMNVSSITYAQNRVPIAAESTHLSVRFTSMDANYGKISNLTLHYTGGEAD